MPVERPAKAAAVLKEIERLIGVGRYRETQHAQEQMAKRHITSMEVRYVLLHGRHEKRKDEFNESRKAWNYAVRGWTIDNDRKQRTVVALTEVAVLLITAIDLAK